MQPCGTIGRNNPGRIRRYGPKVSTLLGALAENDTQLSESTKLVTFSRRRQEAYFQFGVAWCAVGSH